MNYSDYMQKHSYYMLDKYKQWKFIPEELCDRVESLLCAAFADGVKEGKKAVIEDMTTFVLKER